MYRHPFWASAFLAGVAGVLLAPAADAAPFGVSVGVGPGGVSVQVGRGVYYPGYYSIGPVYPYYNSRYYYYGWGGYPYYPGVYNPPSYSMIYPPPSPSTTYPYNPAPPGYQSFYPPQSGLNPPTPPLSTPSYALPTPQSSGAESTTVLLNLRLPDPNAEVWIDGTRTNRQGATRQFISPPLTPGKKYSYEITARWLENGREVSQTRKLIVQAGQQFDVDFTRPAP
jgi:uncharacterized protein (TIGR03000 family)